MGRFCSAVLPQGARSATRTIMKSAMAASILIAALTAILARAGEPEAAALAAYCSAQPDMKPGMCDCLLRRFGQLTDAQQAHLAAVLKMDSAAWRRFAPRSARPRRTRPMRLSPARPCSAGRAARRDECGFGSLRLLACATSTQRFPSPRRKPGSIANRATSPAVGQIGPGPAVMDSGWSFPRLRWGPE